MRALVVILVVLAGSYSAGAQVISTPPFEAGTVIPEHAINGVDTVVGTDGNILYVWDNGGSSYRYGELHLSAPSNVVLGRVYSPDGSPILGSEIRLDTTGRMEMWISAGRNGDGYLVAWASTIPVAGWYEKLMLGRRLDATGTPLGAEVPIDVDVSSDDFSDFQDVPVVAGLANGGSVVVWLRNGIVARVFDSTAHPIAPRFAVAGNYSWDGRGHDVAGLADGGFVVVWSSWHYSGKSGMRVYDADGQPRTDILPASESLQPSLVAASPSGGFIVAGYTYIDEYRSLRLRYYAADGSPQSDEILVHAMTSDYYIIDADLKVLPNGNVAVEWREYTREQFFGNLRAQLFDANGSRIGPWVELPGTAGSRLKTAVLDDGRLVNAWTAGSQVRLYLNALWANLASFYACTPEECPPTPPPTSTFPPSPTRTPTPRCGDGSVDASEECDDGNQLNGDGCDTRCRVEDCGNGRLEGDEQCDPPQADACRSDCTLAPVHDSVMVREKPIDIVIPAGQPSASKIVPVQVRNADIEPVRERPGHVIGLVASDGTCPAGTVAGLPDFERGVAGDQDSILVPGGTPRTALVTVVASRAAFSDLDRKIPQRCTLVFTAEALVDGNIDPTPENNTITVELNVRAAGDGGGSPAAAAEMMFAAMQSSEAGIAPGSFIVSVKPLRVRVRRGQTVAEKKAKVKITNGLPAGSPDRTVQLAVADGTCPPGTVSITEFAGVSGGDYTAALRAGSSEKAKLRVSVNAASFTSANIQSPNRCTAEVLIHDLAATGTRNNQRTALVIEVTDQNDLAR